MLRTYFLFIKNKYSLMKKTKKNLTSLLDTRQHHWQQFGLVIDKIVNLCTYGVILSIVGYMFARLLKSFALIFAAIVQSVSLGNSESVAEGVVAPEGVIHAVPITIILVKAYKILLEYAKTQHVNIKYVLEIAITAPVVEIVFNFSEYNDMQLYFMGGLTVLMSLVYLYFYDTLKQVEIDYAKEHNLQE